MNTRVALLRGINVGGKLVAMSDVERIFLALGFENVQIYIRTGNIIFQSQDDSEEKLTEILQDRMVADIGLDIRVLIRSAEAMRDLVERNPFIPRGADPTKLHVTFLSQEADHGLASGIDPAVGVPDEFATVGRDVYLHCPEGYGRTKLNNAFWERKLKVAATTRNWNTVTRLVELTSG